MEPILRQCKSFLTWVDSNIRYRVKLAGSGKNVRRGQECQALMKDPEMARVFRRING
jgi:hypothetical protein